MRLCGRVRWRQAAFAGLVTSGSVREKQLLLQRQLTQLQQKHCQAVRAMPLQLHGEVQELPPWPTHVTASEPPAAANGTAAHPRAVSTAAAVERAAPVCLEVLWRAATHAPRLLGKVETAAAAAASNEPGALVSAVHEVLRVSLELLGTSVREVGNDQSVTTMERIRSALLRHPELQRRAQAWRPQPPSTSGQVH
jgi:hypothetical protein